MSIETLKGLERKASFSIKKDDVQTMVKDELKKYAKNAKAPGFRPGKVPHNIVEQMYGGSAYEDSLNNQINKKFTDIVKEHKLNLAGNPKFDLTQSEGEEFVFAAIFEVMPEIKLGNLAEQEVTKPNCQINSEHVQKTIDSLLSQRATYSKEDKAAEASDKVVIDFVGTVDGTEFDGGKADNYPFVLGQNMMLPEFENGIIGMRAEESKNVEVNFPDNYQATNLQGKKAIFKITLRSVEKRNLPALNEEFIKSIGIPDGTEDTLTKEIRENIEREVKRRLKVKLRDNVLNGLSKSTPIDVPNNMVHDEIHHMMHNTEENMKKQGYKPEQIKLTHEMFAEDARRFVTLRFLVQEYIKENKITVSDNEVKATIVDLSTVYEDPQKYVTWYYQDQNRVNNAKAITMENKVIDDILTKVKVKNLEVNYDDLMREQI